MWNCVFRQDAYELGKHGDTSGRAPSRGSCSASSSVAVRRGHFTTSFVFCGAKLWLFGAAFFLQVHELLAAVDGVPWNESRSVESRCPAFMGTIGCGTGAVASTDTDFDAASDVGLYIGDLVTLLEDAKDEGFVLVCQVVSDVWDTSCGYSVAGDRPVPFSLAAAVPCTSFQTAAQELHDLLPARYPIDPTAWQDWLDCDLQFVHAECKACPAIWDWLTSFASWYDAPLFLNRCMCI